MRARKWRDNNCTNYDETQPKYESAIEWRPRTVYAVLIGLYDGGLTETTQPESHFDQRVRSRKDRPTWVQTVK